MIAKFQHSVTLASYNEFLITKTKQHFKKENIPFKIEIYLGRGVTRTGLEQVFQPCLCDTSYGWLHTVADCTKQVSPQRRNEPLKIRTSTRCTACPIFPPCTSIAPTRRCTATRATPRGRTRSRSRRRVRSRRSSKAAGQRIERLFIFKSLRCHYLPNHYICRCQATFLTSRHVRVYRIIFCIHQIRWENWLYRV